MDFEQPPSQDTGTSLFQLSLDANNSYTLRSAASWAKVLGVVGMILGALFIVWCGIMLVNLSDPYEYGYYGSRSRLGMFSNSDRSSTKAGLWVFIISGVVFVIGGIFSFSFGNKINAALKTNNQEGLNNAFSALRNYYALRSITLIIVLLLLLITFASSI